MPIAKLQNVVPNARNRNSFPNVRTSGVGSITTSGNVTFGGKGYPIPVLLSVTATKSHTTPIVFGGRDAPNARIFNI